MATSRQTAAGARRRSLRARFVLLGGLALPALALLAGCAEKTLPQKEVVRPVKAMQVADASQLENRYFPGRAKATREVDLCFRVAGLAFGTILTMIMVPTFYAAFYKLESTGAH